MALYASCPYKMFCFYQNLIVPIWGYHTGLDEWHAILVMMETGWGRLTWRTHCSTFSSNILSSKRGVIVALGRAACLYLCPTLLYRWDFSRIHDPLWFCCLPGSPVHEEAGCDFPTAGFSSHTACPAPASGLAPHPTGAPWIPEEGTWWHSILKPNGSIN